MPWRGIGVLGAVLTCWPLKWTGLKKGCAADFGQETLMPSVRGWCGPGALEGELASVLLVKSLELRDYISCFLFVCFLSFYFWLLILRLTKRQPPAVLTELDSDLHLKLRFLDHYGNEPRTMYIDCRRVTIYCHNI